MHLMIKQYKVLLKIYILVYITNTHIYTVSSVPCAFIHRKTTEARSTHLQNLTLNMAFTSLATLAWLANLTANTKNSPLIHLRECLL